jgi:hypothetical protein
MGKDRLAEAAYHAALVKSCEPSSLEDEYVPSWADLDDESKSVGLAVVDAVLTLSRVAPASISA